MASYARRKKQATHHPLQITDLDGDFEDDFMTTDPDEGRVKEAPRASQKTPPRLPTSIDVISEKGRATDPSNSVSSITAFNTNNTRVVTSGKSSTRVTTSGLNDTRFTTSVSNDTRVPANVTNNARAMNAVRPGNRSVSQDSTPRNTPVTSNGSTPRQYNQKLPVSSVQINKRYLATPRKKMMEKGMGRDAGDLFIDDLEDF